MSSPPLDFPTSSIAGTPASARTPAGRLAAGPPASSSPLHFPSSEPESSARRPTRNGVSQGSRHAASGMPSSSAGLGGRGDGLSSDAMDDGSEPLFLPGVNGSTPRRPRRGDIHSSLPFSSSPSMLAQRRLAGNGLPPNDHRSSSLGPGAAGSNVRSSSPVGLANLTSEMDVSMPRHSDDLATARQGSDLNGTQIGSESGPGGAGSNADDGKFIWGTNVGLNESMNCFRDFLRNFKPKYRGAYNKQAREQAESDAEAARLSNTATWTDSSALSITNLVPFNPLYDDLSSARANETLYLTYLRTMRVTQQTNLNLDALNLLSFPSTKKLYHQLLAYPQEVIPIMDQVLKDLMIELGEEDAGRMESGLERDLVEEDIRDMEARIYKVRPFGGGRTVNMRDLNPGDTDKLVSVKGLVIRATPVIPDMKQAFFRCAVCQHTTQEEIDRGRINEPTQCPRELCGQRGTMTLIHNRCDFADKQVIRLQETPDVVPDGQTPHTVSLCAYDELVDLVKPGDRVTITGIFRSTPVRVNPRQRSIKALFKTYIDVVHVKRTNVARMGYDPTTRGGEGRPPGVGVGGEDDEEEGLSAADRESGEAPSANAELEQKLLELSRRPDIYEMLSRSMAPSIWEMDDVKKGILLQLFGGTNKSIARGGGGGGPRYRGDINVLMYVHKIAPRGVYTSGKGSSAVGLTAYVTRDPDSKQLVLESGALVLSDGGVCCIDEFDKMSDATRSVLHEVMEQQTVSIAKAGIITTLNARTSILAAANPVNSKYNPRLPIPANIDLPPTLISRFDLLYLVLDKIDEMSDMRLAKHLVGLYLEDKPATAGQDILPVETLTAYITYARSKIHPTITEEASEALVSSYVEMRKVGEDIRTQEKRITATTRQLESMIRLSEAHARMRFSEKVELKDVKEAFRLIREAIRESATDPITGQIDLDLITTGAGQQQRRLRGDLKREILALLDSSATGSAGLRYSALLSRLETQSSIAVDANEFAEAIKALEAEAAIKVVGEREKRMIRKVVE